VTTMKNPADMTHEERVAFLTGQFVSIIKDPLLSSEDKLRARIACLEAHHSTIETLIKGWKSDLETRIDVFRRQINDLEDVNRQGEAYIADLKEKLREMDGTQ
jgi:hypothetical protein